jgi:hypothetical protein
MHDPNPRSDFWARSLFMTDNEIRAELAAT